MDKCADSQTQRMEDTVSSHEEMRREARCRQREALRGTTYASDVVFQTDSTRQRQIPQEERLETDSAPQRQIPPSTCAKPSGHEQFGGKKSFRWKFVTYANIFDPNEPCVIKRSMRSFSSQKECINDAFSSSGPWKFSVLYRAVLVVTEATVQGSHNNMADADNRMWTFNAWPPSIPITKERMVRAGFYYEGKGDAVTCFHCHVTLLRWQYNEDPWVEHEKHSPLCSFVQRNKNLRLNTIPYDCDAVGGGDEDTVDASPM